MIAKNVHTFYWKGKRVWVERHRSKRMPQAPFCDAICGLEGIRVWVAHPSPLPKGGNPDLALEERFLLTCSVQGVPINMGIQ